MPDFSALTPKKKGQCDGFDLARATRTNNFAIRFEAFLMIDREDDYTFHVTSDDGGILSIDGKVVSDNDGIHPDQTGTGKARLTLGMHRLVCDYFDGGGERSLDVEIESIRVARQSVEPYLSLTDEIPKPEDHPNHFAVNRALADKGRDLFASIGCASCHQLREGPNPIASTLSAPRLSAIKPDAGCLSDAPPPSAMRFGLSAPQKAAITQAIAYLAKTPPAPDPKESIARAMTSYNCYACHSRDGVGGVEEARNASFESTYTDLGDEGRLPPLLNGVGAKLTSQWLGQILASGGKDRPYMKARMPKFGAANVGSLATAFASADPLDPAPKVEIDQPIRKVKAVGRQLVGSQAFGCVQCHNFRGEKSAGIPAIDMTLMTRRLRHDWFVRYVVNPAEYRPGTRMPSAWPGPESQLSAILDGSSAKQIEAVWDFLSDGTRASLPVGIGRNPIPLVAYTEPIIYRNFIEGAGPRAIAVGYPEKANLAFDANQGRIALIWQGNFIDAGRHWSGRGEGFQSPMGDNVIRLPEGPNFAPLKDENDPWPTVTPKGNGYQFLGYKLDKSHRPAFRYTFGPATIEDRPEPIPNKDGSGLRRDITIADPSGAAKLWYRAAIGSKILPEADGWYAIDVDLKIKVEGNASPILRDSGGKKELLVPISTTDGAATLIQSYRW